jgi:hypothetical protein
LAVALYNSRGPDESRAFDGGDQEREVAKRYFEQAEQFVNRWARTANVLHQGVESYEVTPDGSM